MNTIERAKNIAINKHNQPAPCQRYGSQPYSKHLQDVVDIANKYINYLAPQDREDVICACWGHDLIEDTEFGPSDLEKLFNVRVADLILRVSNERGWDRKERNFKTYPKIWSNDLAIFIKLCDRIANTRNSKETGYRMYETYKKEYPVFKYALNVRNLYPEMWEELDQLNS